MEDLDKQIEELQVEITNAKRFLTKEQDLHIRHIRNTFENELVAVGGKLREMAKKEKWTDKELEEKGDEIYKQGKVKYMKIELSYLKSIQYRSTLE